MSLINIGLSGLNASNAGLSVTAHNIANVQTAGYSRQRIGFNAMVDGTHSGAGVMASSVERMADNYLNQQIYTQRSNLGYFTEQYQYMERTEFVLHSGSTSLSKGLDRFYAALSEASAKPNDMSYRQTVMSETKSMVHRFNSLSSQLDNQNKQVGGQLDASISKVNSLAAGIATMNDKLRDVGSAGSDKKELLDARDEAIRELSQLMDVNTTFNQDGTVSINFEKGQPLVVGNTASQVRQAEDGSLELLRGKGRFALDGKTGGSIGGLLTYRDGELRDLQQKLDVMAYSFATQFNEAHSQGFDLNGAQGKPLFGGISSIEGAAKNITVLTDDAKQLAFSSKADETGNNENLQQLIGLKNEAISVDTSKLTAKEQVKYQSAIDALGGKSLYSGYTGLTGDWAIQTAQMKADTQSSQALLDEAQGKRDSASGVNLDEEASGIMTYTQMYQANAKVISVAQQLFDVTLSMFR